METRLKKNRAKTFRRLLSTGRRALEKIIKYGHPKKLNGLNYRTFKLEIFGMNTLLFCTSYAGTLDIWEERWARWLKAIIHSGIRANKILIVDDGSPVLPTWPNVAITSPESSDGNDSRIEIRHFSERLGQHVNGEPFPGWYRSFAHAVLYAIEMGFDKIIHVESDAFLITDRAVEFFNDCNGGWVGLWCPRYSWPESTMQIISRDQFASAQNFFSKPYAVYLGPESKAIEHLLPFTNINKTLIGDRYGEDGHIVPLGIDFVSQVRWHMDATYYWWLSEECARRPRGEWWLINPGLKQGPRSDGPPRVVALSMVKNEQDIIEPFVRHTARFVDYHIVLENGSVDDTHTILKHLMKEVDGLAMTSILEFGYKQSERMSRLLRICQAAFFADYVIFLDADEFIATETRSQFEEALARIPAGGVGYIQWQTFVLSPSDSETAQSDPPRSIKQRRAHELTRNKIVMRLDRKYWHDLVVAQGNHNVTSSAGRQLPSVHLDELRLSHFPIRSINQFIGKSIVGWMAYLSKDPHAGQKGEGYHWRENFDLALNGKKIDYEKLCELSMNYDQPRRNIDWTRDISVGSPPSQYHRSYSSGLYADPLTLIAKSWHASLQAPAAPMTFNRKLPVPEPQEHSRSRTTFDSNWHWQNPFADIAPFRYLADKYEPKSVCDVGCGIGAYLAFFKSAGSEHVFGLDKFPVSATMLETEEYKQVDLSRPQYLGRQFDIVMCLEVSSHLPFASLPSILETVRRHADNLIVFSAAEPGQPGYGHINALPIEHWLRRWSALDWFPLLKETFVLRALSSLPWFKRNLVVLKRGIRDDSKAALYELETVGALPFAWHHTDPGVRAELLTEDMPMPPFGYKSEA